jgi:hypothetical protein
LPLRHSHSRNISGIAKFESGRRTRRRKKEKRTVTQRKATLVFDIDSVRLSVTIPVGENVTEREAISIAQGAARQLARCQAVAHLSDFKLDAKPDPGALFRSWALR